MGACSIGVRSAVKLETQFLILLVVCLGLGLLAAGSLSYRVESDHARHELATTAELVLETADSLREYTLDEVAPRFGRSADAVQLPALPSYAAAQVLTRLGERLPHFDYREVGLEPIDPRNRATDQEVSIIRRFLEHPDLAEVSGVFSEPAPARYYLARPLRAGGPGCLACHGELDLPSQGAIAAYHASQDLRWNAGDLVAVQIVEIPLQTAWKTSVSSVVITSAGLASVFLITGVAFLMLIRRAITVPLETLTREAEQLSLNRAEAEQQPRDAMSGSFATLDDALRRLRVSVRHSIEIARTQKPKL